MHLSSGHAITQNENTFTTITDLRRMPNVEDITHTNNQKYHTLFTRKTMTSNESHTKSNSDVSKHVLCGTLGIRTSGQYN